MAATGYNVITTSDTISFRDGTTGLASIAYDHANETLSISQLGTGAVSFGDTASDLYIGDGVNSVDLIFEVDGAVKGDTDVTLTLGATDSDILIASPVATLTGSQLATESWVLGQVVDSAPSTLNTLNELAAALGDDANYSTTISTALGNRLRVDTASQGLSSTEQSNARTNLGLGSAATSNTSAFLGASAKAADSNLLDGIDSSSFLRSDTTDTFTNLVGQSLEFDKLVYDWTAGSKVPIIELKGATSYGIFYHEGSPDQMLFSTSGNTDYELAFSSNGITHKGNTIWHAGNHGSGSGLDADLLDGAQPSVNASSSTIVKRHASGYIYANYINTTANDVSSGVTKIMVETGNDGFMRHGDQTAVRSYLNVENGANNYSLPLAASGTRGGVQIGYAENGQNYPVELSSEKMFVNVPWTDTNTTYSAGTHLTLSGTTFNVDFATADKVVNIGHNSTNNEGEIILDTSNFGSPQISFTDHGDASWAIGVDDASNNFKIHGNASSTIPTINSLTGPLFEITTGGLGYLGTNRLFADNYHPNADTLTTSRTISLGGDLSGSAEFNGSSNITITAAVADDSHNHIISNVDGLQTALDGKLNTAGGTMTGNLEINTDRAVYNASYFATSTASTRHKFRLYYTDTNYAIGMQSNVTYGGLNNDWAMTFQFNSDNDRGFWWGDSSHTTAQGAMALTTQGKLSVARTVRVGYGETDTTIPSDSYADYNIPIKHRVYTASTLPSASPAGQRAFISDSAYGLATAIGSVVSGGGSNTIPVYSDGSSWRAG